MDVEPTITNDGDFALTTDCTADAYDSGLKSSLPPTEITESATPNSPAFPLMLPNVTATHCPPDAPANSFAFPSISNVMSWNSPFKCSVMTKISPIR